MPPKCCQQIGKPSNVCTLLAPISLLWPKKVLDRILGVHMHGYVVCRLWGSPVDERSNIHCIFAVQGPVLLDPTVCAQHSQCHAFHVLFVVRVLMNEQSLQCTFHSSYTAAFTLVTIDL